MPTVSDRWKAAIRWVAGHFFGGWIAYAGTVILIAALSYWKGFEIWTWVNTETQISNAWLLALVVLPSLVVFVSAWLLFRPSKPNASENQSYSPIAVIDPRLNLLWRVIENPSHWIDSNIDIFGPEHISHVIDGPFHLQDDCHQRLRFWSDPLDAFVIPATCTVCKRKVYKALGKARATIEDMKRIVMEDLQAQHISGSKISDRVRLKAPVYWQFFGPPFEDSGD